MCVRIANDIINEPKRGSIDTLCSSILNRNLYESSWGEHLNSERWHKFNTLLFITSINISIVDFYWIFFKIQLKKT